MPIAFTEEDFFNMCRGGVDEGSLPYDISHKILIEGDSWVHHPVLNDIADHMSYLGGDDFAILNVAKPGDTSQKMFDKDSHQLKRLEQLIHDERFGYTYDFIFVSAGGNDIVGPEIASFVKPASSGRSGKNLIDDKEFNKRLKKIATQYYNVIGIRNKSRINKQTPLVTNVYSYLKPRRVGTQLFGMEFGEGWVARYLEDYCQITDAAEQQEIIIEMLDRFHEVLSGVAEKRANFHVVDGRKVLAPRGKPNQAMFSDEIHPNFEGFKKVTANIRKSMQAAGIWPV